MRTIKFRAWDKVELTMIYNVGIDVNGGIIIPYTHIAEINGDNYLNFVKALKESIMQYTGLKDKNGKEIYEGDIVKGRSEYEDEKVKKVKWSTRLTGFSPFMNYDADCDSYYLTKECEIIGNIYENPELIKNLYEHT